GSHYRTYRRRHHRLAREHRHAHGRATGHPAQHRRRHRRIAGRQLPDQPPDRRRQSSFGRARPPHVVGRPYRRDHPARDRQPLPSRPRSV
ncbi:MAG: Transglycosylase-associated protein, partial [uncultured Sphingomonadaceae bacterium]